MDRWKSFVATPFEAAETPGRAESFQVAAATVAGAKRIRGGRAGSLQRGLSAGWCRGNRRSQFLTRRGVRRRFCRCRDYPGRNGNPRTAFLFRGECRRGGQPSENVADRRRRFPCRLCRASSLSGRACRRQRKSQPWPWKSANWVVFNCALNSGVPVCSRNFSSPQRPRAAAASGLRREDW